VLRQIRTLRTEESTASPLNEFDLAGLFHVLEKLDEFPGIQREKLRAYSVPNV